VRAEEEQPGRAAEKTQAGGGAMVTGSLGKIAKFAMRQQRIATDEKA